MTRFVYSISYYFHILIVIFYLSHLLIILYNYKCTGLFIGKYMVRNKNLLIGYLRKYTEVTAFEVQFFNAFAR